MTAYRVTIRPSADKVLHKLPRDVQRRILERLDELAINPRPANVVKMAGGENLWRIRVGDYRLVYEIHDREITIYVLAIGHRREVYREF
ncbi:MAG: type II toxin-antitoxin system RelE family toxin [Phycisphaerae bacterium]